MHDRFSSRVYGTIAERDEAEFERRSEVQIARYARRGAKDRSDVPQSELLVNKAVERFDPEGGNCPKGSGGGGSS